jgi:hypothetical protein
MHCKHGLQGPRHGREGDSVWIDGLASIRAISHETEGLVKALFTFRDGS